MSAKKPPQNFKGYTRQGSNNAGWGSFGYVYFYHSVDDHRTVVAVKAIPEDAIRTQEVELLKSCNHPNIVRYIDCSVQDSLWLIVTELLSSSLHDAFRAAKKSLFQPCDSGKGGVSIKQNNFWPKLKQSEMYSIANDCFKGLMYLHNEKNIIHRDIYPPNILLEVKGSKDIRKITAKLCDFGLSKQGSDGHHTNLQNVYSAPETTDSSTLGYSLKADVFSLGVVIAEMVYDLSGVKRDLFNAKFVGRVRAQWAHTVTYGGPYGNISPTEHLPLLNVVLGMTEEDPSVRVSIDSAYGAWRSCFDETETKESYTFDEVDSNGEGNATNDMNMDVDEAITTKEALPADLMAAYETIKKANPAVTEQDIFQLLGKK